MDVLDGWHCRLSAMVAVALMIVGMGRTLDRCPESKRSDGTQEISTIHGMQPFKKQGFEAGDRDMPSRSYQNRVSESLIPPSPSCCSGGCEATWRAAVRRPPRARPQAAGCALQNDTGGIDREANIAQAEGIRGIPVNGTSAGMVRLMGSS
ncbi:MAG: hypothetical protein ACR2IT_10445 [Pirellulales bacterium]